MQCNALLLYHYFYRLSVGIWAIVWLYGPCCLKQTHWFIDWLTYSPIKCLAEMLRIAWHASQSTCVHCCHTLSLSFIIDVVATNPMYYSGCWQTEFSRSPIVSTFVVVVIIAIHCFIIPVLFHCSIDVLLYCLIIVYTLSSLSNALKFTY